MYRLCLFLVLYTFFYQTATAGSFGINPVKLTFSGERTTEVISLRNDGDQATVVQVELVAWTQENGRDVYTPTQDLLATPPIFTVATGNSQIIRVGLRHPANPQRELAYRMFLQEVPPPKKTAAMGLQVALRISVPVFIEPQQKAAPVLRWQAKRVDAHTLKIEASNTGNIHDHLSALKIYRTGGSEPLASQQQLFAYLLPGQTHAWSLNTNAMPNPGESLRIVAKTEAGEIQAEVVLETP